MFNFLKKLFKKNPKKEFFLGIKKLEYDFIQWSDAVLKTENIDLTLLDDLEILFIKSDIGFKTSSFLITQIKQRIKENQISKSSELLSLIKNEILSFYQKGDDVLKQEELLSEKDETQIFLFVGVNGVGKTTTIGKLAAQYNKQNKKVLLVAGDTFRTGAIEQLKIWGSKTNNEVFYKENSNSTSSVFFEALTYAKNRDFDIILCDTSGRLENKVNLMKELEKVKKVIKKIYPKAPHKTFLILDAMIGQNGLKQVELFNKTVSLSDIILTKFDGIAKGGLILTIKHIYNLPTKYIGIGEKVDDLILFDINQYIDALFGK
ncbi:signal recognition particle-docking protein FtsY [Candidatus Phytoplasma ziziphi]|uniref:Signal recognition particle-docking protein FtsY n=1 Tax=Ziziphus jujuba witches'-broom phytoplasma TaxID=135727 RepID=A0A660HN26_ZIZJU|nr:signal recognition particle-docking protein FtsY [Candidatus Phytoplasma ziziphi]AYJ01279.1 signal recognition particle-docking protein FtsY [Candidatus Phytoplasma ziziphi]